MEKVELGYDVSAAQSGACVIILVVLTIILAFGSFNPQNQNILSLVVAFGFSAIAVSIFHLGNILSKQQT